MKKFILLGLSFIILISMSIHTNSSYAATTENGSCGTGVSWKYVYDIAEEYQGTLTISGSGKITDYARFYDAPWYCSTPRNDPYTIDKLIIKDGIKSIGDYAFWREEIGSPVELPNSVTRIGKGAFGGSTIENITFGNKLSEIGEYAFGSTNLKTIYLPDSVQRIGKGAFYETLIDGELRIPDNVCEIGANAFYGTSIRKLIFGKSMQRIEDGAFADCTRLNEIIISNSVTCIGPNAFKNCSALKTIRIPASVTHIEQNAFKGCSDSMRIYYTGTDEQWQKISISSGNGALKTADIQPNSWFFTNPDYSSISNNRDYTLTIEVAAPIPGGELSIMLDTESFSCISNEGVVIQGIDPTVILTEQSAGRYFAIPNNSTLSFSTAEEGLITLSCCYTYIDENGTKQQYICQKQIIVESRTGTTISPSPGSSGPSTIPGAPYNPSGAEALDLSVEKSNWNAEQYLDRTAWDRVKSVTISSKVKNISPYAFSYLEKMTSITIPVSITQIGFGAFNHTKSLTDVYYKGTIYDWNKINIAENNTYLQTAMIHFKETETPTVEKTETNTKWSFDITTTQQYKDAYIYTAIYDQSDIILAAEVQPFIDTNGANFEFDKSEGASYVKILILTDLLQPLTKALEKIAL